MKKQELSPATFHPHIRSLKLVLTLNLDINLKKSSTEWSYIHKGRSLLITWNWNFSAITIKMFWLVICLSLLSNADASCAFFFLSAMRFMCESEWYYWMPLGTAQAGQMEMLVWPSSIVLNVNLDCFLLSCPVCVSFTDFQRFLSVELSDSRSALRV